MLDQVIPPLSTLQEGLQHLQAHHALELSLSLTSWENEVLQRRQLVGVVVDPLLQLPRVNPAELAADPLLVRLPRRRGRGGDHRSDVLQQALDPLQRVRVGVVVLRRVLLAQTWKRLRDLTTN